MAKDTFINKKRCRYYQDGGIYVSDDGTLAAMPKTKEVLLLKRSSNGTVYVNHKRGHSVCIAIAVITCFCPPKPKDGKRYVIKHKDGNSSNCHYKNLVWELDHYAHTTASEVDIDRHGDILVVHKDGTVRSKKGTQYPICDDIYDSDTDLQVCVEPYITVSVGSNIFGKRVHVEELMKEAGFVNGDDAILENPVILHRDFDRMNFSTDNLEWVEETDQRYKDYLARKKTDIHKRNVGLNQGKELSPGM